MRKNKIGTRIIILVILVLALGPPYRPAHAQTGIPTPLDLINAVNELRANFGLPPLEINSSLMTSAQSHANYQASIGTVTHYGADGSRPYHRALAAGYGGGSDVVISENIAVFYGDVDMHRLLYNMWADEAHWNTMTKATYRHIGAGVSQSGGRVFLTINVGWIAGGAPVSSGGSSTSSTEDSVEGGVEDTISQVIMPVVVATHLPDGTVIHLVMPGQAMWSIAVAYQVKIVDIANLNRISPTDPVIYAGQELLIQPSHTTALQAVQVTQSPGEREQPTATLTTTPTTPARATSTPSPRPAAEEKTQAADRTTLNILLVAAFGLAALVMVTFIIPRGRGD